MQEGESRFKVRRSDLPQHLQQLKRLFIIYQCLDDLLSVLEVFIASLHVLLLELLVRILFDHYLLSVSLGLVARDGLLVSLPPDSESAVESSRNDEVARGRNNNVSDL